MKTIIVLDKDFLLTKAFQRLLSQYDDCDLVIVRDHDELMNACLTLVPDMVFIGIAEGEVDFIRTMHQKFPSLAIYVMTFSSEFNFLKHLINAGIKDYLLKPISLPKIKHIIESFDTKENSNYLTEKLLAIVINKKFQEVHRFVSMATDYIDKEWRESPNKVRQELSVLKSEAIKLMNVVSNLKKEQLLAKFSFTDEVILEKYRLQFLLFQLVDEIFRQQSIQRTQSLQLFYSYIDQHLFDNVTLSEAAEACHMSQGYLSRLIKERYHISFSSYIQYRKIELAKELFYFNDEKIIDVSFQLSYSESSYFCKVFKKIEGKTPLSLKKDMELQKNNHN